jgi:DNA-binding NarL/FixJ family response regulator
MIRVVVFDDSEERLVSLTALFSINDQIDCVGTFSDCTNFESKLNSNPDVILMDIRMPAMDGITATTKIKQLYPGIKVIMQTVFDDDEKIFLSLKAGAEGYILKSTTGEKIIQCIEDVFNGGAVMTPSIALRVAKFFNAVENSKTQLSQELTAREKDVLVLLTEGLSYKMVASRLDITYNTVNAHIKKIYEKLSVNSLGEAISMAIKNRIV